MINPSSPVTGAAITGLTSPTYTITSDNPPDSNSKAWVVTALGGTQTGVSVHKNELPFRFVARRPKNVKIPGARSLTTGQFLTGGKNEYSFTFIKGVNVTGSSTNPQYDNIIGRLSLAVPAAVGNDSIQLDALCSFIGGIVAAIIQSVDDTAKNSVL